ncbi:MAG: allantoate amidohydrolase [Terriglobales bacterium]
MQDSETLAREVVARCQTLARFSEDVDSLRRTFLSPPMRDCHREIEKWIKPFGATSQVDAVGNLRVVYPANNPHARRLMIGSHLDTVPNAGAYDGILGVVLAIALLGALDGRTLPFAIEIVGFSEEEGVRFGTPFIGSRALVGSLDEETLNRQDAQGMSIRTAISDFGLYPAQIADAAMKQDVLGYVEFHIEQGPVLDNVDRSLGVVEVIAGQSRLEFTFVGCANHAGTTPMHLRHDALAGAAEWIGAVERKAQNVSGLVATVGTIQAKPGAANVIAGETRLSLDVRHQNDGVRNTAIDYFVRQAEDIAKSRGLRVQSTVLMKQPAVAMDPLLISLIQQAIASAGCEPHRMVSGAGHDAMIMAAKVPAAMIFLRSPGGISHDPAESVNVGDVEKAIDCGVRLLDQLALSGDFRR